MGFSENEPDTMYLPGAWMHCMSGIANAVGWRRVHQCGSKLPELPGWQNGPVIIRWQDRDAKKMKDGLHGYPSY